MKEEGQNELSFFCIYIVTKTLGAKVEKKN